MNETPPIPRSTVIQGIEWLNERLPYPDMSVTGDTYPLTWADDDAIYMSSGDPNWHGVLKDDGMDVEKIEGDPPRYRVTRPDDLWYFRGGGGHGPKPSGMICVEGSLYLAFQNMLGHKPPAHGTNSQHGSDAFILVSHQHGQYWLPHFTEMPPTPMFPGYKFGGPAFVNFGKNNAGARDEYVYALSGDQWDNGSDIRLGRVPATTITDPAAWEWVSDLHDVTHPQWSDDLEHSLPIVSWERHLGMPDMVYLPAIKRYLLLSWHLHEDFNPSGSDLIIMESPEPWGPFSLVHYAPWEDARVSPYCPRIPLKWLEPDGLTGWMLFSGSWGSPDDQGTSWRPYYRPNVRKFRLTLY